ncbi:MAG: hypothetical protein JO325_16505 [Solirubrobacterales bacterium]|nr:hypothetical protein [Solirubrobacterales bacterium]
MIVTADGAVTLHKWSAARVGAVDAFAVDGGTLTELGSVLLRAGATPAGVVVN